MSEINKQQQIPGIPIGAKLVRIGNLEKGINYICWGGLINKAKEDTKSAANFAIVEPDNDYGKFLHEVEEDIKAAGRERLGGENDYRLPKKGEEIWSTLGKAVKIEKDWEFLERIILAPRKTKRVLVIEVPAPQLDDFIKVISIALDFPHGTEIINSTTCTYRIEERPV